MFVQAIIKCRKSDGKFIDEPTILYTYTLAKTIDECQKRNDALPEDSHYVWVPTEVTF